jgi:amino acid transporter
MPNAQAIQLRTGARYPSLGPAAITINGVIGAGIFGLPAKVYALIGSYSLIAFVACALVVTLIILCFAASSRLIKPVGLTFGARGFWANQRPLKSAG